jgi:uncharacterized protein with NAD-binding domain and iron-sulfur cluster
MAGLTVAHELIERGFEVTVYERNALGGKARSIPVLGSGTGGRRALPGEHGFRFFPGFYHHVPDTMRRIPFAGNEHGVWDNLMATPDSRVSRAGREDIRLPAAFEPQAGEALTVDNLRRTLISGFQTGSRVPPQETAFFVDRLLVFFTSCDERRYGQWEHTSWKDFVRADGKSEEYRKFVVGAATRAVVAAKEYVASTRTIGNMAEAFVMNAMGRGNDGAPDRVLNAPTNEAWIDPWVLHLENLGVRFATATTITSLKVDHGRIAMAGARDRLGRHRRIEADWFVCALPPERARRLWNRDVLALDPQLELMNELFVDWMAGIQFFLTRRLDLAQGHITFIDAPWALTGLTQGQFWKRRTFARDYGDGRAVDCLSVDISDWDTPGILYGKPAKVCTREQIAKEVWAQMQAHLNDTDRVELPDGIVHSWFLDPGVKWVASRGRNRNDTPLLVNTVGSWDKRPQARISIPNLFLAGDYVQTDIDLATMEGANESGRAAVNGLLDTTGSKAARVRRYKLYDPPEFEAAKRIDRRRYAAGQRNLLDT